MRAFTSSAILAALALASTVSAKPAREKTNPVEPEAIEALRKMSGFLTEQKSFSVRTEAETDYVLDNGQKIRLSAHGNLRVRRPSHLRADVVSDRKERELFFDGKTFTVYSPKVGYYARVPAPATIIGLADQLQMQYGIELPLVDLWRWGGDQSSFSDIQSATHVGSAELDGVKTEQYAFRQKGVDWQIWIEAGDKPLPRKLVVTTTDDAARPEHAITMSWKLDDQHDDSLFTFTPPKDALRIGLAELGAPKAVKQRRAKRSARRTRRGT
jgi:hypothetical protein